MRIVDILLNYILLRQTLEHKIFDIRHTLSLSQTHNHTHTHTRFLSRNTLYILAFSPRHAH